jgi:hypothetical protein
MVKSVRARKAKVHRTKRGAPTRRIVKRRTSRKGVVELETRLGTLEAAILSLGEKIDRLLATSTDKSGRSEKQLPARLAEESPFVSAEPPT